MRKMLVVDAGSINYTKKVTSAMSEEEIERKKQIVDDILDEKTS